jgi:hypothetical protein
MCVVGALFFLETPIYFISFPLEPQDLAHLPLTHALVPRLNHTQYGNIFLALVKITLQLILFGGESIERLNHWRRCSASRE